MLRSSALVGAAQVLSHALSFGRNILLARILAKADFGFAALLATMATLLELAGRFSIGQQLIQSPRGHLAEYQATAQALYALLCAASAALLIVAAVPMASAVATTALWWPFALLAAIPLARAFEHLDYCRLQREMNFLPSVLIELVPQFLVTVLAIPLAIWLRDFRALLVVMVLKSMFTLCATHILAQRRYTWAWNPSHARGMLLFGAPLLMNGFLLFAGQQADQILIGTYLSLEDLAAYSVAYAIISVPVTIFAQIAASVILPLLSRSQGAPDDFSRQYGASLSCVCAGAVITVTPLINCGGELVSLAYGTKYADCGAIVAVLAVASIVRLVRIGPGVAAMARGDSKNLLYSNIGRFVGVPLAVLVIAGGGSLLGVAATAVVGEVVALAVALRGLHTRHATHVSFTFQPYMFVVAFVAIAYSCKVTLAPYDAGWANAVLAALVAIGAVITAAILFPTFRRLATLGLKQVSYSS